MTAFRNASIKFAFTLMCWGVFSVAALIYTIYLVTRLSVSFFQANGMINNPELTEAIYYQLFSIEAVFFYMLLLGFFGVGVTAYLFSNSQYNYFKKLSEVLTEYSVTQKIPSTKNLGPFAPYIASFIIIVNYRIEKKDNELIESKIAEVEKSWPLKPQISWLDQVQFAAVSGLIASFFTVLSTIFFWKVTDRLVELSGQLVRYKVATGPTFFNAQTEIVGLVMWTIFAVMMAAFAYTGFRFGQHVSEASYAVLRDLRKYMRGDLSQRIFLRGDDPAKVLAPALNDSLQRLSDRIQNAK